MGNLPYPIMSKRRKLMKSNFHKFFLTMNDCLAGTKVYMNDVFLPNPMFEKGEFISSWLCDDNVDGFGIKDLCCLAWVKPGAYEMAVFRELAYMSFGITVNHETCCKCGKKSIKEVNCPHLESKTASSVYDFKNFFGVSIYTAPGILMRERQLKCRKT